MPPANRFGRSFFHRATLQVARELLGQRLVRIENEYRMAGIIIETEAYIGSEDLACHARSGRTKRTEVMWGPPGHAYVYFTYGIHWMLNFVTEDDGFPAAVLLRGLWPIEGLTRMKERRPNVPDPELTNGPAKLCQAIGIDGTWNGYDMCKSEATLFIEQMEIIHDDVVTTGPRVGLNNVPEPWKSMPWRFEVDRQAIQT